MEPTSSTDEDTEARLLAFIAAIARQHAAKYLNAEEADDLARDVMTECLAGMRAGTWVVRVSLVSLVSTMTRTRALNVLQQRRHRQERETEFSQFIEATMHTWMSPELTLEEQTLGKLHERMLASLPHNCRLAYTMVREERVRYQAVADRLGISRLAVCKRVVTAQHHLRERLREEDIAAPPPARGPRKRYELAHQHTANHAAQNDDADRSNADTHQDDAMSDGERRASDAAEPSPSPAKRKRRRRSRRHASTNRGVDPSILSPEQAVRRSATMVSASGTNAPPGAIGDPLTRTVPPKRPTDATPIGTVGTIACLDAPACA
jgi:RNA polymerase sigma factor (sigma-70 family)